MDFKIAKLDGLDIVSGSTTGIYYATKEWRQLTTDDSSTDLAWYHGRRVSATFARKRVITFEGYVRRFENINEQTAVEYLQNLLCLQSVVGSVVPRTLYIKDMYDLEWTLPVKVREPVQFVEYDSDWKGAYWKWMATLESVESPIYRSNSELLEIGTEWTTGGFRLGVSFPASMSGTEGSILCSNSGNVASPIRFEITATDAIVSPLSVFNITHGTLFSLDIAGTAGDVVVIDSNSMTATMNGVSVVASRMPGSVFPTVESGTTEFVVSDATNWFVNRFSVSSTFRDALL